MARIVGADDSWLDVPRTLAVRRRDKIKEWIGQPIQWLRGAGDFVRTTPGIMAAMTLIISVTLLAAGIVTLTSTDARRTSYQELSQTCLLYTSDAADE